MSAACDMGGGGADSCVDGSSGAGSFKPEVVPAQTTSFTAHSAWGASGCGWQLDRTLSQSGEEDGVGVELRCR